MKNQALHHLKKMGEHHEAMAKVHRDLAAEHEGLSKSMTSEDRHYNISSLHKVAQQHHADMASHCEDMQRAVATGAESSTAGVTVDTAVPTNASSFGGREFTAALADELAKRWGLRPGAAPLPDGLTVTAPSDESARKTAERVSARLVGRDGQPIDKDAELGKAAAPEPLAHWF